MKSNINLTHGCVAHGCCGCSPGLSRRGFLQGCGAAAALGAFSPLLATSQAVPEDKIRIAVVFFANSKTTLEMWPYPNFDCDRRIREVTQALRVGCPQFEFTPVVVAAPADFSKALALKDSVDGYLVYIVTLNWEMGLGSLLPQIGRPLIVANEFLGGCGSFLTGVSAARKRNIPLAAVSSTRLEDLVAAARVFSQVKEPGSTPAVFAQKCEEACRKTFPAPGKTKTHCMAHTKVFGTNGPANPFRIRTLHNRDPRGCCAQSFMPEGYLTTSFLVYLGSNTLVIHQAQATGNLDVDRGCRTQLVGEVRGDIVKLFNHWDAWHRVTLYGDVKEPLAELGRALGLKIVEEA